MIARKRILIVDDSAIVLAAAEAALVDAGFDVATCSTFEEVGALGTEGFALILMDVHMPELFGDDVAAVLRHEREVKTPIYLFSMLDDAELAQRAKDARVDGFISKGAGVDHLVAEVKRILGAA